MYAYLLSPFISAHSSHALLSLFLCIDKTFFETDRLTLEFDHIIKLNVQNNLEFSLLMLSALSIPTMNIFGESIITGNTLGLIILPRAFSTSTQLFFISYLSRLSIERTRNRTSVITWSSSCSFLLTAHLC